MQKHNLDHLIEFNSLRFNSKVLINEPACRLVLMSMEATQSIPENALPGTVAMYVLRGSISFSLGNISCDLHAGELVTLEEGIVYRVEANQHSALLVMSTGIADAPGDDTEELDLRELPFAERQPLILAKFDALAVGGSMRLLNDYDPLLLSRQFENLRPGQALWEYIVRGPGFFRTRIRRIRSPDSTDGSLRMAIRLIRRETNVKSNLIRA
jgi:uncharacterized protein (DUF2249 family)